MINNLLNWFNQPGKPFLIAGPCSAESPAQVLQTAKGIALNYPNAIFRAGVWKPRTRPGSFEGKGEEALVWLNEMKAQTGLRFAVIKKGNGNQAKLGQFATINYSISLLDGTLCYDSKKTGPETFLIGQDHVESGLHEGIQKMQVGDKCLLIMPPHLAHGLLGDDKKIPPLSCIVYEVELLQIKDAQ